MELKQVRERMAEHLTQNGVEAVCAYPAQERPRRTGAVCAVSVRACQGGPGGFQDYLGERFDETRGVWQELYGKRIELTFGLDLYAPGAGGAQAIQTAFDKLAQALRQGGPPGLKLLELSCGETQFDREAGLCRRAVEARYQGYLYAVAEEGGSFSDFIVRGESRL